MHDDAKMKHSVNLQMVLAEQAKKAEQEKLRKMHDDAKMKHSVNLQMVLAEQAKKAERKRLHDLERAHEEAQRKRLNVFKKAQEETAELNRNVILMKVYKGKFTSLMIHLDNALAKLREYSRTMKQELTNPKENKESLELNLNNVNIWIDTLEGSITHIRNAVMPELKMDINTKTINFDNEYARLNDNLQDIMLKFNKIRGTGFMSRKRRRRKNRTARK